MNIFKALIVIFICIIIISCSPQLYKPVSTDATVQQQLLDGRKLYVDKCGSCHNLHLPKEFGAEKWQIEIDKMQQRSRITDKDKQLILQFLTWKQ